MSNLTVFWHATQVDGLVTWNISMLNLILLTPLQSNWIVINPEGATSPQSGTLPQGEVQTLSAPHQHRVDDNSRDLINASAALVGKSWGVIKSDIKPQGGSAILPFFFLQPGVNDRIQLDH